MSAGQSAPTEQLVVQKYVDEPVIEVLAAWHVVRLSHEALVEHFTYGLPVLVDGVITHPAMLPISANPTSPRTPLRTSMMSLLSELLAPINGARSPSHSQFPHG